jgi:hypothetical protein
MELVLNITFETSRQFDANREQRGMRSSLRDQGQHGLRIQHVAKCVCHRR